MKRAIIALLALNLVIAAYAFWPKAGPAPLLPVADGAASSAPVPVPATPRVHDVVMYGTAWCGYCAKTRQYFAAHGIRYTEHDIEASEQGSREFEALGGKGIPLVLIDGTKVQGFNPEHMDYLLAQ